MSTRFLNIIVIMAFLALASGDNSAEDTETGSGPSADSGYQPPPPPYGYPAPYAGLPAAYTNGYGGHPQEVRIVYVERPSHPHGPHGHKPSHPSSPHPPPPHHGLRHPDEYLKGNCTLEEVRKEAEICGPDGIEENCEDIETTYMKLTTEESCYDVTRTVCEEQTNFEEKEICTYQFKHVTRQEQAQGVVVKFLKTTETKEVEICEKKQVYGGYGKTYEEVCDKADQETKVSSPQTTSKDIPVTVSGPEVEKTCITKRMKVPMIDCRDEVERKCTMAPKLEEAVEKIKVCRYDLGKEECRKSKLYLPQQSCVENVEEKKKKQHHYSV